MADESYQGYGATRLTPQDAKTRLVYAMMQNGMDASPIRSPWQGAARLSQALLGAYGLNQQMGEAKAAQEKADADYNSAIGTPPSAASVTPQPSSMPQNTGDFGPQFDEASTATGIPKPLLIAQARQESGLNPNAVGRAGEVGMTQIMPSTARNPGFGLKGVDPEELRDPSKNIMFGAQYLAARGKAAGVEDWNDPAQATKGLMAYNGGGDPNYANHVLRYMPAAQPQQPPSYDVQKLTRALQNPNLNSGQQIVLRTMLDRALRDPTETALKQAQLAEAQGKLRMLPEEQKGRQLNNQKLEAEIPNLNKTTDIKEYERAKTEGFNGTLLDYQTAVAQARAAKTTVNATPGPAANVFKEVSDRADAARSAAQSLPAFQEARNAIDSGKIVLGAGADMRLGMQKIGALFGLDPRSSENSEVFRSAMAPVVLATIKGLGAGSGISNADREFAEKAAGGNINLEPGSIRRLLDIGERAAAARIKNHNDMIDKVYPESDTQNGQVRALFRVDAPKFTSDAPLGAPPPQVSTGEVPASAPAPAATSNSPPPPPPGFIKNGWQFKGGNPADPSSWQQVQ